ncbi:DUF397 domain-containing protein [Marinitenerispora sediminis]|uniref:DUF397 domain-containing protein n=1 Tax=Marinitenerispora sediminis TaxID=1931232 RepID=A0A368T4Q2_9ACTN|nr:DUF397 domain-containing protein [Marinitenerispora sediminis]RCV58284.1 DUF397 domain-containing protein [Marinitenerispora sediminis]RCV58505.1 DUF397 domain-containing protein [Marinitenerispora sediminis]
MSDPVFRKSSHSAGANECVEVASVLGSRAVRDSKHPKLGHLTFGSQEWTAFLGTLRRQTT